VGKIQINKCNFIQAVRLSDLLLVIDAEWTTFWFNDFK